MSVRKLLALALLAGIIGSTAACADITGPEKNGVCQVSGGSSVCTS